MIARRAASAGALLVILLGAGCGDLYVDPVRSSADFGEAELDPPEPSIDAADTVPRDVLSQCPAVAVEGSACNVAGVTCEYGSSPDMRCNTTVACLPDGTVGGAWVARPSTLCPSYQCPSGAIGALDGTPCGLPSSEAGPPADADELVCPLDDGVCACSTGADAAHAHARRWVCVKPDAACPTVRPLAGQACTSPRSCDYGSCRFKRGLQMQCTSNVWITGGAQCQP